MERISLILEELVRLTALRLLLPAAAYLLPKRLAIGVADLCSLMLLILPAPGWAEYWSMRAAFGKGRVESIRLSQRRLRQQFRAFVVLKRVANGREQPRQWQIVEKNADAVRSIRNSGDSYIVATGHFLREALIIGLGCPAIVPGKLIQVTYPTPPSIGSFAALIRLVRRDGIHQTLKRERIRTDRVVINHVYSAAWNREVDYVYVSPEPSDRALRLSSAVAIYQRLKQPGNVVNFHVDTYWLRQETGSLSRAFVGRRNPAFSTGPAQLAKLAQCPILSCIYWAHDDGTIFVEWGKPILRVDDEINVTNDLLDMMERAIGEHPTHYVDKIGSDRRWNPACRRWI